MNIKQRTRQRIPFEILAILFMASLACGTSATPTTEVTPIPTETSAPTNTPLPPTVSAAINSEIIIETSKIIDAPVQKVENMLGSSIETLALGIGDSEDVPDGGETRTYQVGKYQIYVDYDKQGIAKGLQIFDGLLDDGYSIDQWPIILTRIGVGSVGLPDIKNPNILQWKNAHGYFIAISTEKAGGNVWTVRIYKIP